MPRSPTRLAPSGVALAALLAAHCGGPAQSRAAAERREAREPRGRLDSATAATLCANPEQARAGLAPCELRDQAIPPDALRRVPAPPPPPPR